MKHKFLFLAVLLSTLFTTSLWAQTPGYAIYGNVPYGYEDLTSKVTLPAAGSVDAGILSLTGTGLPGRLCESNYLSFAFNEAVTMTLTGNYAIHVVLKRAASANNVQLSLCKNGWNAARASFELPAASISADDYADVTVAYGDRRTDNWNSWGEGGMIDAGGVSFPAAEMLRISAANSEVLYISQIYIDADATSPDPVAPVGDTDAPESLTLAASNIVDKCVTLTASATDANSPINYTFYYKAEDDADFTAVAGTVNAASGADAVKVVTGLTPSTTYSFKVVATDPSSNSSEESLSNISTDNLYSTRYYLFRGDNSAPLPTDKLNSIDVRPTGYAALSYNNASVNNEITEYAQFTINNVWCAIDHKPKDNVPNEIDDSYYLVVRFKTNMSNLTNNKLRFNLSNGAGNAYINNSAVISYNDENWHIVTLPFADMLGSKPAYSYLSANQIDYQIHVDNGGATIGNYIAIDYVYFTNDISELDPGTIDIPEPAPTNVSVVATETTWNTIKLELYADCETSTTVSYAIVINNDIVKNTTGAAGETTEFIIDHLTASTEYTFSVIAKNEDNNSAVAVVASATTQAEPEGVEHRYYLWRGDNSDIPSSASVISTYVDCNVEFGNAARDNRASDYISAKTNNTWIAFTFKPKATVANEIDDNWYIVVRFRSNLSNNVFGFNNFRLNLNNNAENWYINNSDDDKPFGRDYNDGKWIVIKKRIGDRRAGSAVPASYLQASQVAAQLHVSSNLIAGEFLDVDYVYFTDDITNVDEGTQFNKRIALKDAENNTSVLSANNSQTVDIDLTRSLTNASYNTLCLPFDLSAEQVANIFGAGTTIGKLTSARIKENDELYLNFSFVDAIEAGVPYLIQPENNVANPLIENVTIDNTLRPADFEDVDFKGVFKPTEIQVQSADSYTILLLGANNTLSWPNETANMKGMRAYFDLSTQAASVVRRARFGFESEQTATGIDQISNDQSQITNKVVIDGQLIIIRDGVKYNAMGVKIQ